MTPRARAGRPPADLNGLLLRAALVLAAVVLAVVAWLIWYVATQASAPRTDMERRLQRLESLSAMTPTDATVWGDWATNLIAVGDLAQAEKVLERGSRATTDTLPLKVAEVRLLVAQGDRTGALRLLNATVASALKREKALSEQMAERGTVVNIRSLAPQALLDALVLKGELLTESGDMSGAIGAYTLALERDPQMADVLVARGDLYAKTGDSAKARADYTKALTMVPGLQAARDGIERLKGSDGQ